MEQDMVSKTPVDEVAEILAVGFIRYKKLYPQQNHEIAGHGEHSQIHKKTSHNLDICTHPSTL